MAAFTLVSGNKHKLAAWRRIVPASVEYDTLDIDTTEVQGTGEEIVRYKLREAFKVAGRPVVVEDAGAGLDKLGGFPGHYVKDLIKSVGKSSLFTLANEVELPATATCVAGYYDGELELIATGQVHGTVVSPAGENGFGFDFVFIPDGESLRYAEMTDEQKDTASHRRLAIDGLMAKLELL